MSPEDAADMLDELLEAQNKSRIFGLKLNLPLHVVDAIQSTYSQPEDRLLQVLIEFTKQIDPRPTWRVVEKALKTPSVNLPHLAKKVAATHFPDPTSTCDVASEPASTGIRLSFTSQSSIILLSYIFPQMYSLTPSLMSLMI